MGDVRQEIADKLGISKNGVRWNLDDMVEKGGFESRESLVATAIENKLMVTTLNTNKRNEPLGCAVKGFFAPKRQKNLKKSKFFFCYWHKCQ